MALMKSEKEQIESALKSLGFWDFIPTLQIESLIDKFTKVNFEKGDSVLLQGRSGGAFFILYKGKVSVWADSDGSEKLKVAEILPVTYFGEIALLEKAERIATLIAEDHVEVFVLGKKDFFELLFSVTEIREKVVERARERKKDTGSKLLSLEEQEILKLMEEYAEAKGVFEVPELVIAQLLHDDPHTTGIAAETSEPVAKLPKSIEKKSGTKKAKSVKKPSTKRKKK